jgi:subtilase family serine protease
LVGSYKILVWTDSDGTNHRTFPFQVTESDDSNNYNLARPIQINAPPLPDLQTTIVQAQEEVFAGQPFNLNWRVENRGDATTPPNLTAWNDKIYLSQNTTFEPNLDRLIGSRPHDGRLLATEGYSVNSYSVTLPNDIAGNWYVFVVTDGDNQIFEFGNENNNSNYDREQPGSPMLIRTTPPDLIIPNVISAPNNGNAAGQITVGWTVQNQGAFDAAPNWFDTIYLSSDATLDTATDTPLGTIARGNLLGAGLSYDATANVTLPSCISGNYYLFVFTDSRKQIFEYDPTLNAEANNTSTARQISITSSPSDLRVTAVANPVSGVAGQPAAFSWTVANQGTGTTLNTVWNDEVYLSPTANFVKANSTRIGAFTHNGALAVGGSYSQTQNIVIPNSTQGNYYVFVLTDANDNVEECGAANGNNFEGSATIFNVSNSLPDLTVSNFAFANSFIAGQNVNVTWSVANGGTASAQNSSWGDSVYFSTNNVLDSNDRRLTDVIVEGGLAPNAAYTKTAQVTLPIVAPGSYFLIVKTDNGDNVFEGQGKNNNTRTLVLPIDVPPVDLQVTAVNAPASVFSGQSLTIDWTIQNTGNSRTVGSNWTDAVVLSLDQIDDPTDRVIGYLQHEGALNGGANYTATTDVAVPSGLAGQYYIFIRADRNNQLAESNENNNSSGARAVSLQLAPPSDLIVTSVTQPANASPGEPATFNWTVQNTGANPATGLWTDTVYLSSDQTWDIGDVLVGRYTAGVNVAPGQSYNGTLTTTLPAVNLGNYYVIIRTDIRNRVIETNENNNTGASGGTTTVDVPTLQLGVPQSTTLVTGQERFYKFNAPANETVRVSLDGEDGSSNELYTRFGQMASRNAYDFLFDRLYESDQQLVIPNTNAGTYYNMIRGENVPNSLANNEVKQVGKPNTKPIDSKQAVTAENVTVKAEIIPFSITSVSPNRIGDNGQVTITLKGAKFAEGATVKLVQGNNVLNAAKIIFADSATIKARFFFTNAPHGAYDVVLVNPNNMTAIVNQSITIETATSLQPSLNTISNGSAIVGRYFSTTSELVNTGNVDIPYAFVLVAFTEQSQVGIRRGANTYPRQSDNPIANWKYNSPTSDQIDNILFDQFFIRDLEPNGKETFQVNVLGNSANEYSAKYITKAMSTEEFIQLLRSKANTLRNAFIENSSPLPPDFATIIQSEGDWWNYFANALINAGWLEIGVVPTAKIKNSNLKANYQSGSVQSNICAGITGLCNLYNASSTTVCILDSLLGGGPVGIAIGALVCVVKYFLPVCQIIENSCNCLSCVATCVFKVYAGLNLTKVLNDQSCRRLFASDPNDKQGPIGFGLNSQIGNQKTMPYTINFENMPTATASAQRVRVTDQLDPNVDPRTFRLKEIGFGSYRLQVPENRAFFQQRVQLGAEFNNILADISAGVDISTGKVTWTLTAIDPATGEQPNSANLGLLAPNDETGRGQGFVTYTVQPKQTAPTGTVIRNNATIIFDTEEPITTNTVTNTLDADIPTSAVAALPPTQTTATFTVSWAGTDAANGSGLQNYDVWVAENDGAYQPFVSGTTDLSAEFTGTLGKTYRFYSIARDNAGNVEAAPTAPDATTRILNPTAANVSVGGRVSNSSGGGISRARITMTAPNGAAHTVTTNTFGYYHFDEVPAGGTYIFNIQHSRYRFDPATRIVSVIDEIQDIDFQAISR